MPSTIFSVCTELKNIYIRKGRKPVGVYVIYNIIYILYIYIYKYIYIYVYVIVKLFDNFY